MHSSLITTAVFWLLLMWVYLTVQVLFSSQLLELVCDGAKLAATCGKDKS